MSLRNDLIILLLQVESSQGRIEADIQNIFEEKWADIAGGGLSDIIKQLSEENDMQ